MLEGTRAYPGWNPGWSEIDPEDGRRHNDELDVGFTDDEFDEHMEQRGGCSA